MFHGLGIAAFVARLMPALLLAAITAQGQAPAEFTNLQFFPKTISRDELIGVMRGFSFSLNVRCQYCHVGKSGNSLQEMDFASDDRETKKIARNMLRMVDAINQEYIAKLGRKAPNQVGCVTCHHRLSIPITMNALLAETLEKKDIPAAIALYRDLRKKDYGGGQYDFGETPLNQLTESLLKQHKTKEAVAIMELNVEVNTPPSLWGYNLLAMAHKENKETEKAKADYQKILELNPQDAFAKKQLEELNSSKQYSLGSPGCGAFACAQAEWPAGPPRPESIFRMSPPFGVRDLTHMHPLPGVASWATLGHLRYVGTRLRRSDLLSSVYARRDRHPGYLPAAAEGASGE